MLAWLSILAAKNKGTADGGKLVTVKDVAEEHWKKFGRNFFRCATLDTAAVSCHVCIYAMYSISYMSPWQLLASQVRRLPLFPVPYVVSTMWQLQRVHICTVWCSRYDFEGVESDKANEMMAHLREIIADNSKADFAPFKLDTADDFEYTDPIDGPHSVPAAPGSACIVYVILLSMPWFYGSLQAFNIMCILLLTGLADLCSRERGKEAGHSFRVRGRLAHHLPAVRDWLRWRHCAVCCATPVLLVALNCCAETNFTFCACPMHVLSDVT